MEQLLFCDVVAGELIFMYHTDNLVAGEFINQIRESPYYRHNHIRIIESMDQKLAGIGLKQDTRIPLQLYRLGVPGGQEIFKINWLLQHYNRFCIERISTHPEELERALTAISDPPEIGTNAYYDVASTAFSISNGSFSFTPTHEANLKMINHDKDAAINPKKKVLIIDSGISANGGCNVVDKRNFLLKEKRGNITNEMDKIDVNDETGHGTAIASIIQNVLPGTELIVYKIVDKNEFSTEWNLLAALCASNDSSIINISLTYGLKEYDCNKCGRLTTEARSGVLEWVIAYLNRSDKIVVAAAGNKMLTSLSYPARLSQCVAIISVNTHLNLSDFSNRSKLDQANEEHPYVFSAPGGNKEPEEKLFSDYIKTKGLGTSFSAAYASAIICAIWSKNDSLDVKTLLEELKNHYAKKNPDSNVPIPGNGLLMFSKQ